MQAISINAARTLGQKSGARQVVIIALDGDSYGITTWGKTRAECQALAKWAEKKSTVSILQTIADAHLDGGSILTTPDPDAKCTLGVE